MEGATMPNDPLLQLAQDVGSLKSSVKSLRDSQTEAWRKIDDVRGTVTDINRKLDAVLAMEARVKNAEEGVADYKRAKSRFITLVLGIGAGSGGAVATIASYVTKIFGTTPPPSP